LTLVFTNLLNIIFEADGPQAIVGLIHDKLTKRPSLIRKVGRALTQRANCPISSLLFLLNGPRRMWAREAWLGRFMISTASTLDSSESTAFLLPFHPKAKESLCLLPHRQVLRIGGSILSIMLIQIELLFHT
jgi:hypothetical protein